MCCVRKVSYFSNYVRVLEVGFELKEIDVLEEINEIKNF